MFCPKCGTQNPDTAATCSKCGSSLGARSAGGGAGDKFKAASQDALTAFKTFATDPVGGLPAAANSLGNARAMGVGIIFGVVFTLLTGFGIYRVFLSGFGGPGVGGFLKMLLVAAVPFVCLAASGMAVRKLFGGQGGLGMDTFIAGAACLPFGVVMLLGSLLGAGNLDVIYALSMFAICFTILMLFSGLTRIGKTSERAATIAVPLMLLVSAWLAKTIYASMLRSSIGF